MSGMLERLCPWRVDLRSEDEVIILCPWRRQTASVDCLTTAASDVVQQSVTVHNAVLFGKLYFDRNIANEAAGYTWAWTMFDPFNRDDEPCRRHSSVVSTYRSERWCDRRRWKPVAVESRRRSSCVGGGWRRDRRRSRAGSHRTSQAGIAYVPAVEHRLSSAAVS